MLRINYPLLKKILENRSNLPHEKKERLDNELLNAFLQGNFDKAKDLILQGANANIIPSKAEQSYIEATLKSNPEFINFLIKIGTNFFSIDDGLNFNDTELIQYYGKYSLKQNISSDFRTSDWFTARGSYISTGESLIPTRGFALAVLDWNFHKFNNNDGPPYSLIRELIDHPVYPIPENSFIEIHNQTFFSRMSDNARSTFILTKPHDIWLFIQFLRDNHAYRYNLSKLETATFSLMMQEADSLTQQMHKYVSKSKQEEISTANDLFEKIMTIYKSIPPSNPHYKEHRIKEKIEAIYTAIEPITTEIIPELKNIEKSSPYYNQARFRLGEYYYLEYINQAEPRDKELLIQIITYLRSSEIEQAKLLLMKSLLAYHGQKTMERVSDLTPLLVLFDKKEAFLKALNIQIARLTKSSASLLGLLESNKNEKIGMLERLKEDLAQVKTLEDFDVFKNNVLTNPESPLNMHRDFSSLPLVRSITSHIGNFFPITPPISKDEFEHDLDLSLSDIKTETSAIPEKKSPSFPNK